MDNDKLRALAAKWRKNPGNVHMQVVQIAREQCADELEALLASEKPPGLSGLEDDRCANCGHSRRVHHSQCIICNCWGFVEEPAK